MWVLPRPSDPGASGRVLLPALGLLVAGLFAASLLIGPAGFSGGEGLGALFSGDDSPVAIVMREIRLPRALLAMAVGASLGLSGAAIQGLLRNPLAEPGLIGVSGSAALGAVIALQTGLAWLVLCETHIESFKSSLTPQ